MYDAIIMYNISNNNNNNEKRLNGIKVNGTDHPDMLIIQFICSHKITINKQPKGKLHGN